MKRSAPVDGFSLAYDHRPAPSQGGPGVVLLHGWPGDHTDYRAVGPLIDAAATVVIPDLRGFGESDKFRQVDDELYAATAQARSIAGLIEELGLVRPVVAGYDIGSRIAQRLAADRPDLVGALVLSPPLPGTGLRVLDPATEPELWYQGFHRSGLAAQLIDGDRTRIRTYLEHFWNHWSGPDFTIPPSDLDHLVDVYGNPGDLAVSTAWYRSGAGYVRSALAETAPSPEDRLALPVAVLWQENDPLFPQEWADRLGEFFKDVQVTFADSIGHFVPVEGAGAFAGLINSSVRRQVLENAAKHGQPRGR